MTYMDASDDTCTAAMMMLARRFSPDDVASAAATVLAHACAMRAPVLTGAVDLFDHYVAEGRHELEINFGRSGFRERQ